MPRLSDRPLRRICIRIWDDNATFLEGQANGDFGFNQLIRTIIDKYCTIAQAQVRERVDGQRPIPSTPEIRHHEALDSIIEAIRGEQS